MEISKGIRVLGLSLHIHSTLILSDIHMGYEESLNKGGVLIPRAQFKDTIERLKKLFQRIKDMNMDVEHVIINGDLKHEFGAISDTEWRNTLGLLDFLLKKCERITLIKGNHDTILGPIAKKRNVQIVDSFVIDDIFICHGDEIPSSDEFKKAKRVIIGHEHPAIGLKEGSRTEKFKCFLHGKYKAKELIVMPSFNLVQEGTDVLKEELLSPFLSDIGKFEVVIVNDEGEELYFGQINNLKKVYKLTA